MYVYIVSKFIDMYKQNATDKVVKINDIRILLHREDSLLRALALCPVAS